MDNNTLIILIAIAVGYCLLSKSRFQETNYKQNYDNQVDPPACNYTLESRPYPSGKVPGSYLGLSPQEKKMLLIKFLEYNGSLPTYYETT